MFSNWSRLLVPVLLIIALSISCSVKEDRSGCPCVITVDLREALKKVPPELLPLSISVYGSSKVAEDFTDSSLWQCSAPRDPLVIRVAAIDAGKAILTDNGLQILEGNDCPSIYWSLDKINVPGEAITIVPRMRKDYCHLTVSFIGIPPCSIPYAINFLGNVSGYDAGQNPVPGPFSYLCQEAESEILGKSGVYTVNLPRQKDASLRMDIISEGKILKSFAIGHYIESTGYDWTSDDLEDLDLEVNFAATTITLHTSAWTVVSYYEVMI